MLHIVRQRWLSVFVCLFILTTENTGNDWSDYIVIETQPSLNRKPTVFPQEKKHTNTHTVLTLLIASMRKITQNISLQLLQEFTDESTNKTNQFRFARKFPRKQKQIFFCKKKKKHLQSHISKGITKYLSTILMYFAWVFLFHATLYFNSTTVQWEILSFLHYIYLTANLFLYRCKITHLKPMINLKKIWQELDTLYILSHVTSIESILLF